MQSRRGPVGGADGASRGWLHGVAVLGKPLPLLLIIAEKVVVAVGIAIAAVLAITMRGRVVDPLALLFSGELAEDPHDAVVHWVLSHTPHLTTYVGPWLAVALALWSLLYAVEGVGLWTQRTWAEALVILETAAFLPIEVWDLIKQFHLFSLATLAINVAVLLYVVHLYRRTRTRRGEAAP